MEKKIKRTAKFLKKASKKAGMSPGTLVHVGEQKIETARITLVNYDRDRLEEKELNSCLMKRRLLRDYLNGLVRD